MYVPIVIFTAIPIEYKAVRDHLHDLQEITHPSGSIYEIGHFDTGSRSLDVVIAEVGPGNLYAAREAERAIAYFSPHYAFFVGVAGGLKDVALGDVVVATKVYGYESGKAQASFFSRPSVSESSFSLLQRCKVEARKDDWLRRVKGEVPAAIPRVFVAPIAAGEKVVASTKSSVFRFLKKHYSDAVAVEMEGIGFLSAARANEKVRAVILRGISDLIDGKEESDDEGYQNVAAKVASAFAFQLLSKIDIPSVAKDIEISSDSPTNAPPPQSSKYIVPEQFEKIQRTLLGGQLACVVGVRGEGGVGKSELAKNLAQKIRNSYDQVIWIAVQNNDFKDLLRRLAAFVDFESISNDPIELSNAVKRRYSNTRSFIVLDDVRRGRVNDIDLLVMPPPCVTLITSRIQNIPIVAPSNTFSIGRLNEIDSVCLLQNVIQTPISSSETTKLKRIAKLTGYLPLALDIAARKLKTQSINSFLREIDKPESKASISPARAAIMQPIYRAFKVSFEDLSVTSKLRLKVLSLFHESGFSLVACANVWSTNNYDARNDLEKFVGLSLVQHVSEYRFRLHDFLHEILQIEMSRPEKKIAIKHFLSYYIDYLKSTVSNKNYTAIDEEINNILVATLHAEETNPEDELDEITSLLHSSGGYLNIRGKYTESISLLNRALKRQEKEEQPRNLQFLQALGDTYRNIEDRGMALSILEKALHVAEATNDLVVQCDVIRSIGVVYEDLKDHAKAIDYYSRALEISKRIGNKGSEARCVGNLGIVYKNMGDIQKAIRCQEKSLELCVEIGDRYSEGRALGNLGIAHSVAGDKRKAIRYYEKAYGIAKELKDVRHEAIWLGNFGIDYGAIGEKKLGVEYLTRAIKMFESLGADKTAENCKVELQLIIDSTKTGKAEQ